MCVCVCVCVCISLNIIDVSNTKNMAIAEFI